MNDVNKVVEQKANTACHEVKDAARAACDAGKSLLDQGKDCCHATAEKVKAAVGDFACEAKDRAAHVASCCHDDFCSAHTGTKVVVGVLAGLAAFGVAHFVLSRIFCDE